jgi:hypothetical protein
MKKIYYCDFRGIFPLIEYANKKTTFKNLFFISKERDRNYC